MRGDVCATMPQFPRLLVAVAASATLTVALAAQPASAASQRSAQPVVQMAVHRAAPAPASLSPAQARAILIRAARHHNLNPNSVLAVSYWESGWNQAARSRTGAVGLMQVEPYTAAWAGPRLLHRRGDFEKTGGEGPLGGGPRRPPLSPLRGAYHSAGGPFPWRVRRRGEPLL